MNEPRKRKETLHLVQRGGKSVLTVPRKTIQEQAQQAFDASGWDRGIAISLLAKAAEDDPQLKNSLVMMAIRQLIGSQTRAHRERADVRSGAVKFAASVRKNLSAA